MTWLWSASATSDRLAATQHRRGAFRNVTEIQTTEALCVTEKTRQTIL